MAVTTSKGDGFALYNGVKLPDIDTVWTDKATYPYVYISGVADLGYSLTFSKVQAVHYGNGNVEIRNIATTVYSCYLLPGETEWVIFGEEVLDGTVSYIIAGGTGLVVWTNTDILNTDNTVYFAASDPIPLDGYNVIEWDGDTSGLNIIPVSSAFRLVRIADYIPVPVDCFIAQSSYKLSDGSLNGIVVSRASSPDVIDNGSGWTYYDVVLSLTAGNEMGVPAGTYVTDTGHVEGAVNRAFVSLIAYRTTETPPDEGGGYDKTAFLSGLAMGLTGKGDPTFTGGTDAFLKGYLVGAELRRKRVIVETDVLIDSLPIRWNSAEVTNNTKVTFGGVPFVRISNLYALDEEDVQTHGGTLVVNIGGATITSPLMSVTAYDTVFLAMYNVDGEDIYALSVGADNVTFNGTTFPKKGVYVPDVYVIYGEAECEFKPGIANAYSYNGFVLPNINAVWTDKTTYPYAIIVGASSGGETIRQLIVSDRQLMIGSLDGSPTVFMWSGTTYAQCCVYSGLSEDEANNFGSILGPMQHIDEGWPALSTAETASYKNWQLLPAVWANYDVLNEEDGSVYLAASDPVPV